MDEFITHGQFSVVSEMASIESDENQQLNAERVLVGWESFCDVLESLLRTSERRIGHANRSYSVMIMERLQFAVVSIATVHNVLSTTDLHVFRPHTECLLDALRDIIRDWEHYLERLDSLRQETMYHPPIVHVRCRGRPKFHISRDQLVYLRNLYFFWARISCLLSVSRMTIYRRRRNYGLLREDSIIPNDLDLGTLVRSIQLDSPYAISIQSQSQVGTLCSVCG